MTLKQPPGGWLDRGCLIKRCATVVQGKDKGVPVSRFYHLLPDLVKASDFSPVYGNDGDTPIQSRVVMTE